MEVTTFHALSWSLINRFGSLIGLSDPYLLSSAQAKLFPRTDALKYADLVPRALELLAHPAVVAHVETRWSLVICDEFQDTDDGQWELIRAIRGAAQLLLLGDPHQCIYANLPDVVGVSPQRVEDVRTMTGTRCIELPEASFRDPSGIIPAAAAAIRRREFDGPAISTAMTGGQLEVHYDADGSHEAAAVAQAVESLQSDGLSVAIFSHHNDALAALSDELRLIGLEHEITGLSESLTAAIDAQVAMAQFARGVCDWKVVLQYLAIFITSAVRGKAVPGLAHQVLGAQPASPAFSRRLINLRDRLSGEGLDRALAFARDAHAELGLTSKVTAWARAATLASSMLEEARRRVHGGDDNTVLAALDLIADANRSGQLTEYASEPEGAIQLMNLHQTKGREADATVVVLRGNDFFGFEKTEPYQDGSRLLYVVFSRARKRVIVLTFGSGHSGLVAPFVRLAIT
ncbi:hypothetical protein GCM10012283_26280 [Phycicoccus endophyticus]|nr:hypothetical protein GCM10012283_26280 [Phycicoccus endophyticus]